MRRKSKLARALHGYYISLEIAQQVLHQQGATEIPCTSNKIFWISSQI